MNKPRFLLALGFLPALTVSAAWAQTPAPAVEATTTPDDTRYADPLIQPKLQACEDRVAAFKDKPCDLIFIGDSITQFWLSKGRAVWEKMYAPRHALDFGVGGDKTQNVLWRLDHVDLKNLKPKVAVILIGTNNRSDTPQAIADGVKAVITRTQNLFPGVKIILVSVMPCRRYGQITAVDAVIKNDADNKSIYYLDLIPLMMPIATTGPDGKPGYDLQRAGPGPPASRCRRLPALGGCHGTAPEHLPAATGGHAHPTSKSDQRTR